MGYSLQDFCDDAREILLRSDNPDGREQIRQKFESLLGDEAFCAEYVGPENDSGMLQIYEDSELHFCVLAYNMAGARTSPPHDHGNTWAVYGQVAGYTDMTVWSVADADADDGGINKDRTFRLEPGQAGLFDVREIHSIDYAEGSKFVRVTGAEMSKETRRVFDAETGAVREIEHVGSGNA